MPERIIRPGILSSDQVDKLKSWAGEVFYRRLMSVVDDFGRFDGRNSVLRANLYPLKLDHVSDSDIGKWKDECSYAGLVRVYFVGAKEFIEILKFDQRLRGKPKWPEPNDGDSPHSAASCREPPPSSYAETETKTEAAAQRPPPRLQPAADYESGGDDPANSLAREVGIGMNVGPKQRAALRDLIAVDGYESALIALKVAFCEKKIGMPACVNWAMQRVAGEKLKREEGTPASRKKNGSGDDKNWAARPYTPQGK